MTIAASSFNQPNFIPHGSPLSPKVGAELRHETGQSSKQLCMQENTLVVFIINIVNRIGNKPLDKLSFILHIGASLLFLDSAIRVNTVLYIQS